MYKILLLFFFLLFSISCDKYTEKKIEDLEYLPVLPNEILMVVDEESFEPFPTLIKFTSDYIVISRFQDSEESSTGYENVTLNILSKSYIEDGNHQITIFKTNLSTIKLSQNYKNENQYFIEGLDPRKKLTLIAINENTLRQIDNLNN